MPTEHWIARSNVTGKVVTCDRNIEPLVEAYMPRGPRLRSTGHNYNLQAYGIATDEHEPRWHVMALFTHLPEVKLIHDMIMEGKLSWRQAMRVRFEYDKGATPADIRR